MRLIQGDCLEEMDKLIQEGVKVDMVLTDPPYGTTACKWDSVIPFEHMWKCLNGLTYDNTPIALFGSEPFSSNLRMSNIYNYRYDWIWHKNSSGGFVNAKKMPMKYHEIISIFYKKQPTYNPQGLIKLNKPIIKNNKGKGGKLGHLSSEHKRQFYEQWYTNYPSNILKFNADRGFHPTQKPVELLEYLIKTYTNENETVLDFTMGSGSTGVACINTNRKFIGIELDENYFNISKQRIEEGIKVDCILTDPPYGTTACKWDTIIPFEDMWSRLNKLIKPNGVIALFSDNPFSSKLISSNIKNYKYDWIWEKEQGKNFQHCKRMPLKKTECINVFYK